MKNYTAHKIGNNFKFTIASFGFVYSLFKGKAEAGSLSVLLLLSGLFVNQATDAQTLISPTGDGGFETGATFAANGWTAVNDGQTNRVWYCGTGQAGYTGSRAAFIGNSATNVGNNAQQRTVHLYKSISIPAGATNIQLNFKYKQATADYSSSTFYDYIRVYLSTSAPTGGSLPGGTATSIFGPFPTANVASFSNQSITIDNSFAGTTQNLIFSWKCDNVSPAGYGAIDDVSLTCTPSSAEYLTQLISMNTGSPTWCAGETRTVTATIKNIGTQSWTDGASDFNVGVKWNADADYMRVDAQNLAAGATGTFSFNVTAPAAGTNNLTFDVAREGCFWFSSNATACSSTAGPGNVAFASPAQTIKEAPVANAGTDASACGSVQIGVASTPLPAVTLFREDFESASAGLVNPTMSNWTEAWFGGGGYTLWKIAAACPISGSKSLTLYNVYWASNCDYDDADFLQFGAHYATMINAADYSDLKLSFKWAGVCEVDYDFAQVMYSLDGINWTAFPTRYQGHNTVQTVTDFDLSSLNGLNFYIGFAWTNDNATFGSAFTVDDITITGRPAISYSWSGPGSFTPSSTVATPTVNTTGTYTLTASALGCSSTDQVDVTSGSSSAAPTSVSGSGTICAGNSVTLTAAGGSLAGSSVYEWFTGSCGGTSAGTGPSITVSPSATTDYYVRASAGGGCPATSCALGTVTLPTTGTALSNDNESATCIVTENNFIHFYHSSGRLLASINSNGQNLGNVSVTSYVESDPIEINACGSILPSEATMVMNRHWVITPQFQPTSPVTIRLPFDNSAEYGSLISAANTNANALDNISGINSMKMSKYSGPANVDNIASNNCSGAGGSGVTTILDQADNGNVNSYAGGFNGSAKYLEFSINGFSEFWLHGGSGSSIPLPVELTNFSASCNAQDVDLVWSTASELNSEKFILEKSRDLESWNKTGEFDAAGNSNYATDYAFTDADAFGGISYYRLVQTDHNGAEKTYGPISVSCGEKESNMTVFPNPARGEFTVEITSAENIGNTEIHVEDLTGKVISTRALHVMEGKTQVLFKGIDLQSGTYLVRLGPGDSQIKPVRVVVN